MIHKRILVIYPESHFTKIAVYKNNNLEFLKTAKHDIEKLKKFTNIYDQLEMRTNAIMEELKDNDIDLSDIRIIISRGGLVKPVKSGIYEVNEIMKDAEVRMKKSVE